MRELRNQKLERHSQLSSSSLTHVLCLRNALAAGISIINCHLLFIYNAVERSTMQARDPKTEINSFVIAKGSTVVSTSRLDAIHDSRRDMNYLLLLPIFWSKHHEIKWSVAEQFLPLLPFTFRSPPHGQLEHFQDHEELARQEMFSVRNTSGLALNWVNFYWYKKTFIESQFIEVESANQYCCSYW